MTFRILSQITLLIVAVLIVFMFVQPRFQTIQALQKETMNFQEAVDKASEFNAKLSELLNRANGLSSGDLERLERYIPQQADTVAIAKDIETIALVSGLEVTDISVNESSAGEVATIQQETTFDPANEFLPGDEFDEFSDLNEFGEPLAPTPPAVQLGSQLRNQSLTLEASGPYDALAELLRALESNAYPLRVVELELDQGGENDDDSGVYGYSLTLETYALAITP